MSENIDELRNVILSLTIENVKLRKQLENKKKGDILFSDYIVTWLENHQYKVKQNSYLAYKALVEKHIVPYFKNLNISVQEVTPLILEEYYQVKLSEGLSANSICRHHANMRSALKIAVKNGLIENNPADYVDKPKVAKRRIRINILWF